MTCHTAGCSMADMRVLMYPKDLSPDLCVFQLQLLGNRANRLCTVPVNQAYELISFMMSVQLNLQGRPSTAVTHEPAVMCMYEYEHIFSANTQSGKHSHMTARFRIGAYLVDFSQKAHQARPIRHAQAQD